MAKKPPPPQPSNAPYFCPRCQQVVPKGRENNHMRPAGGNSSAWVKCE